MSLCKDCYTTPIGEPCPTCGQSFDPDLEVEPLPDWMKDFLKKLAKLLGADERGTLQ